VRFLEKKFARSPAVARVAPFVIFLALTFGQGKFGTSSAGWFYFAKTLVEVFYRSFLYRCIARQDFLSVP
jgi:hypothetical protein